MGWDSGSFSISRWLSISYSTSHYSGTQGQRELLSKDTLASDFLRQNSPPASTALMSRRSWWSEDEGKRQEVAFFPSALEPGPLRNSAFLSSGCHISPRKHEKQDAWLQSHFNQSPYRIFLSFISWTNGLVWGWLSLQSLLSALHITVCVFFLSTSSGSSLGCDLRHVHLESCSIFILSFSRILGHPFS